MIARPSLKKLLAERRARNLGLAQLDAKNRCAICKKALPATWYERFGDPHRYCSQDCLDDAIDRTVAP